MKKKLLISLWLLIPVLLPAQIVDGAFVVNLSPPAFEITLVTKMQTGNGSAGVVELEFSFNTSGLSFPSSPVNGTDYILHGDFNSYTTKNITRPAANKVGVNLVTTGSPPPVPLSTTPTNIITLYFTIIDQSYSSQLIWTKTNIAPAFLQPLYTIGNWPNSDIPLPVELSSFTGKVVNQTQIELNWQTITEVNNYGFYIERSDNNNLNDWRTLGFVNGNNSTNSAKQYSFIDINPAGGNVFYYRLKQMDNSGSYEYSDAIEVNLLPVNFELFQNYPNPFNPDTRIKFGLPAQANVIIDLYNSIGEFVTTVTNKDYNAGYYEVVFSGNRLASGVYYLRMKSDNFISIKKIMLLK